jgi:hypothetical protein
MTTAENSHEQLARMCRTLIAINERLCQEWAVLVRQTAKDSLLLADLATPTDALEVAAIKGCRRRAQKILATLGDENVAH